ncbi:MAG: short-chain dehydrogenase/reductase [Ignavibacteriae bacterium]|nr:MAG: short-chain dehydrogenase/reductase [Ignavibacteriota bacterium]
MMNENKAILISGSSTGIGKACAFHLDKLGFKVYAGIRKQADVDILKEKASDKLSPMILDVTDTESIENAVTIIERGNDGELFGLINNAGIGLSGVVEVTPVDEIRKLMEVNVIGLLALTKAMIPLLRKGKGRIINIGSPSGLIALPGVSVYAASKFAVRAITDSLRVEVKSFGVKVILVSPGPTDSEIWKKVKAYKKDLRKNVKPEIAEHYISFAKFGDKMEKELKTMPANVVAKTVTKALMSAKPNLFYNVGSDAKGAAFFAKLPKRLTDWMILKRINQLAK